MAVCVSVGWGDGSVVSDDTNECIQALYLQYSWCHTQKKMMKIQNFELFSGYIVTN